jgi:UDP-3-O-acyl-N-acetylglucosamine deacetylase
MTNTHSTHGAPSIHQHTLAQSETWRTTSRQRRSDVIVVHPAEADSGVNFIFHDAKTSAESIHAYWNSVVDTQGGVTLGNKHGATLRGAIPLLAALRIAGVDNARVEIYGHKIPAEISDFDFYLNMVAKVGVSPQAEARRLITINDTVEVREGNGCVAFSPATEFCACVNTEACQIGGYQNLVSTLILSDHAEPSAGICTMPDESGSSNLLHQLHEIRKLPDTQRARMAEMIGHMTLAGAPVAGFLRAHRAGPSHYQTLLRTVMERRTISFTTVDVHRRYHTKIAAQAW